MDAEPTRRAERPRRGADDGGDFDAGSQRAPRRPRPGDEDLELFRIEVGRAHGVEPRNILGAIANEAGLDARHIGRIQLFDEHSTVELPSGMPKGVFEHLKRVWVSGQQLRISRADEAPPVGRRPVRDAEPGATRGTRPSRPRASEPDAARSPARKFDKGDGSQPPERKPASRTDKPAKFKAAAKPGFAGKPERAAKPGFKPKPKPKTKT